MNLTNATVSHIIFGEGTIAKHDDKYLTIIFQNKTAKFVYPDAFEKYLSATDEIIQTTIAKEIKMKYYKQLVEIIRTIAKEIKMKYYKQLVEKIRLSHPHFRGLIHTTEFDNFISIMKSGYLKSRLTLEIEQTKYIDDADQEVIGITRDDVKKCCRFYYREHTPTNFQAHYQNPVILIFNKRLLLDDRAIFCNMNAAKINTEYTTDISRTLQYNWREILERGGYDNTVPGLIEYKNAYRNCDFLIRGKVSIDNIIGVYFKTENDKEQAEKELGRNPLFSVKPDMFD